LAACQQHCRLPGLPGLLQSCLPGCNAANSSSRHFNTIIDIAAELDKSAGELNLNQTKY